jgi:hypothetical protein
MSSTGDWVIAKPQMTLASAYQTATLWSRAQRGAREQVYAQIRSYTQRGALQKVHAKGPSLSYCAFESLDILAAIVKRRSALFTRRLLRCSRSLMVRNISRILPSNHSMLERVPLMRFHTGRHTRVCQLPLPSFPLAQVRGSRLRPGGNRRGET